MIFDKVEIVYEKYCTPLKIKYSETRKPTFMEFLILSIILNHPKNNLSVANALTIDFKIQKLELFEKAFNDLVAYKLINLKANLGGWGSLDLNTEINKIEVNLELKERFKRNEHWISQSDKIFEVKWIFDTLTNKFSLVKEIEWTKKINNVKVSSTLKLDYLGTNFYDKQTVWDHAESFIKNNKDLFGEKTQIINLETVNSIDFENTEIVKNKTTRVSRAVEVWIELEATGEFKIKSDDKVLENYLAVNRNVANNVFKEVVTKYTSKTKNVFIPKKTLEQEVEFNRNPELISDINIRSTCNLLLVNGYDIASVDEFLKTKDLISNIQYLIIYNSKTNDKTFEYRDERMIVHTDFIDDKMMIDNSLIYIDSDNKMDGYTVVDKYIDSVNTSAPLVYSYKQRDQINLEQKFSKNFSRLLVYLTDKVANQDYKMISQILVLLNRVNLQNEVKEIFEKHFANNFFEYESHENMLEKIKEQGNQVGIKIIEQALKNVIIQSIKKMDSDEIIEVINKYKYLSKKLLLEIIDTVNSDLIASEIDFIFKVNSILQTKNIDGWNLNSRNCLGTLWEFAKNNLRTDLLQVEKYKSEVWTKHAKLINKIGELTKEVLQENFETAQIEYNAFLDLVIKLIRESSELKNFKTVLINLGECLNQFYDDLFKYIDDQVQALEKESKEYINKNKIINYLSQVKTTISKLIDPDYENYPLEIKLAILKYVKENISPELERNEANIYQALKKYYGK